MTDREQKLLDSIGYKPLPPTERREPIRTAMRVLLDPNIPDEHAEGNHNCGECWECIKATILLADIFRKDRRRRRAAMSTDGEGT